MPARDVPHNDGGSMTVFAETKPCAVCGDRSFIPVSKEGFDAWKGGALAQEAFPTMSDTDRETLISGTHPACWDSLFDE